MISLLEVLEDLFYGDDVTDLTVNTVYMSDSALHKAVRLRNLDYVHVLLDGCAKVDALGDMGFTPLHEAVDRDCVDIARVLLENGASLRIKNEFGDAPGDLVKSQEMRALIKSFSR